MRRSRMVNQSTTDEYAKNDACINRLHSVLRTFDREMNSRNAIQKGSSPYRYANIQPNWPFALAPVQLKLANSITDVSAWKTMRALGFSRDHKK